MIRKPYTFEQMIDSIDSAQGRRFRLLRGEAKQIAIDGITRHFKACAKVGCSPDKGTLREVIDDAINGRRVFDELENDEADVRRILYQPLDED